MVENVVLHDFFLILKFLNFFLARSGLPRLLYFLLLTGRIQNMYLKKSETGLKARTT